MTRQEKKTARKKAQKNKPDADAFRRMAEKAGFEVIGFDITWELMMGSEAAISRKELETAYSNYGLDHYYLPTEIEPAPAFRKAVRNINSRMKDREGRDDRDKVTHKLIKLDDRSDALVYAVVDQEIDKANEDVDHLYSTKIVFNKDTGEVKFFAGKVKSKYGAPHPVAKLVKALYEEYTDRYIGWDLMRTLTRNMLGSAYLDGIRLMRQAGRYFVPYSPENEAILTAHKGMIQSLGEGCNFYMEEKYSIPSHVERVGAGASDTFKQQLKDYLEELDAFKAKAPRAGTLDKRVGEYKELRKKIQTYVDRLGIRLDALVDGLKDCEATVKAMSASGHYKGADKGKKTEAKKTKTEAKKTRKVEKEEPKPDNVKKAKVRKVEVDVKQLPSFVNKTTARKKSKAKGKKKAKK